jgi:PAS domain S-box-containing protein
VKLQRKIFVFLAPFCAFVVVAQTVILRNSVRTSLIADAARKGASTLAEAGASPEFAADVEAGMELPILSRLQALKERLGAVDATVLSPEGDVLAHTNVAVKGSRMTDDFSRRAAASEGPSSQTEDADGRPSLLIALPLWTLAAPGSEAQFFDLRRRLGTLRVEVPLAEELATARRIARTLTYVGTGVAVFVVLSIMFFMRRIVGPVGRLARAVETIAAGQFGGVVRVESGDEIGDLAIRFNEMSLRLDSTVVSKDYLTAVLDNIPDPVVVSDEAGTVRWANPAASRLWGGDVEVPRMGVRLPEVLLGLDEASFREELSAVGGARSREISLRLGSGREVPVLMSAALLAAGRGDVREIVWVLREIGDLKRMQDELKESENRFRQMAETIDQVFWMVDPAAKRMLYISPAYEKVWGRTCASLYEDRRTFVDAIHPEDRGRVLAALEKQTAQSYDEIYRVVRPDGSVRWVHDRGFPVRDRDGKVQRLTGVAVDITDRKGMENRLIQSEKLSAVGQLAAGVAHEINNPLGVILGFAQGVVRRLPPESPLEMPLKSIEREAIRCKNLVQDLLTFSRAGKTEQEPLDLNAAISGSLSLVGTQAKVRNMTVSADFQPGLPRVLGNLIQLQQVVINLAGNAFDAMGPGGELKVRTSLDEGPTPAVLLEVTDDGMGIPAEALSKIFEPFFTTKAVGKGTGLGLSLVYEIVRKHSGTIDVESRPGFTRFTVRLPVRTGRELAFAGGEERR